MINSMIIGLIILSRYKNSFQGAPKKNSNTLYKQKIVSLTKSIVTIWSLNIIKQYLLYKLTVK